MVMTISRKGKSDQFWSYLYGICTYNKDSTCYHHGTKQKYAWCANKATGHKYTFTLPEWEALELEHRKVNSEDIWAEIIIDRATGEMLKSNGDDKGIELLQKGLPLRDWQVGIWESGEFN